jgi:acetyl esterase/lipase
MTIAQAAMAGIATLRRTWRVTILFATSLASGCSPTQLVNALVPHDDFRLVADRPYGDLPRQKLDIYMPIKTNRTTPVVIFFYGGNWQTGSKRDYLFVGQALASRGFIAVIPDYRLYPEVRYPAFLEDGAKAVSWTLRHLDELGGDPGSVHLMGHSAGGYIAAMLALDQRWLGSDRTRIASAVGLAGPYDFLPLTDPVLQVIFGTEPDLPRTQPITFADGSAAPLLLVSGLDDTTVRPANSMHLAARVREHGGVAMEKYYPGVGHVALVAAIAAPLRFVAPTLADVVGFLKRDCTGRSKAAP